MTGTQVTAAVGALGSATIVAVSVGAAAVYTGRHGESYSPLTHFISELGELGVSRLASLFDLGLVVSGVCLALFMIGLAAHLASFYRPAIALIGGVAGVSGALVGVFPMSMIDTHRLVALTFFCTAWVAVGIFTLYVLVRGPERFPRWLAIPGALVVVAFVGFLVDVRIEVAAGVMPFEGPPDVRPDPWAMPTLEWATLVAIVAWVVIVVARLWLTEARLRRAGRGRLAEGGAA